jgi:hypothetical protein
MIEFGETMHRAGIRLFLSFNYGVWLWKGWLAFMAMNIHKLATSGTFLVYGLEDGMLK